MHPTTATQQAGFRAAIRRFIGSAAGGGILLMGSAAVALVIANSPMASVYFSALEAKVAGLSVLHWINDALMAAFFLLVGLEIKREMLVGQLSQWSQRALPGLAALGGVALPALVYLAFNSGASGAPHGWAIPAATDIAFALGVLALLGPAVPLSLKVFLTALAIIDDLVAVLIIGIFYTAELNLMALAGAAAIAALLWVMNVRKVMHLGLYLVLGAVLWFCFLKSGVHATLAGVLLAFAIPLRVRPDVENAQGGTEDSPLMHLEHRLQPWVAFLIVPIFGFANAGVSVRDVPASMLLDPVPMGVALGLFLGKQVGIFGMAFLAIKLRLASMPVGASWGQLYGTSVLCGIGFTMSLFIGLLAFAGEPILQDETKLGVLLGSAASAICGAVILKILARQSNPAS
jgi:NhaA family Na+:H+ antiporter